MFGSSLGATVLLTVLSAFLTCAVQALPQITRTGRYLYDPAGTRFYIKGIAYQEQGAVVRSSDNPFGEPSSFVDPLATSLCTKDVPSLKDLGVNTIRVYSVNSSLNHDACMAALDTAGIYTIIDLAVPSNGSIDRLLPVWSTNLLNQYTQTIDVFSKYNNVLGYNIGNEVVTGDHIDAAPFVKAAARDTKAYLKSKGSSALVGYAAIDGASDFRTTLATYLTCDPSSKNADTTSIDMYGLNEYAWCGDSNFQDSYSAVTSSFTDYNVVAYFGEFGCVTGTPRRWSEVPALYSADMNTVWSGGIAFSYFPAQSAAGEFGIVTLSGDTVTPGTEYNNLRDRYNNVTFLNTPAKSSVPASSYPSCPATIGGVTVSSSLPPTPNNGACTCLKDALSCQFTPKTSNYSSIVGELINNGCSLLGQVGGSCSGVGANGSTGLYGRVSACDPTVKASYVMSLYYEAQSKNQQACSFNLNGTTNAKAASAADAAASSCNANPGAVFTPSAAPSTPSPTATGNNKPNGGAVSLLSGPHALGLTMTAVVALLGGLWTLA